MVFSQSAGLVVSDSPGSPGDGPIETHRGVSSPKAGLCLWGWVGGEIRGSLMETDRFGIWFDGVSQRFMY
jgi:hypothetical protein